MPFNTGKLKEATIDTHVEFAGQRLDFSFAPSKLQKDWYARHTKALRDEKTDDLIAVMLEAVTSWDMQDDNEDDVPLELEAILDLELPVPLIGMINNKIQTASQDGGDSVKKGRRGR